ncbi:MAG: helix-turn-helix transcriptional regulator [Thermogemmatispora sp.]|uniref:helix-turn-helix domain-containing protein n=1 Tax=Thermogemmatispora sp. TaxID=1968838 RepID=UPI002626B10D|nr:helix-turn-helix transcriptional regulator [Thermogemmatispora sp.]MBX5457703.1 helix-turn-helix transcriptional regulator [Thermogemmatispora sp.]
MRNEALRLARKRRGWSQRELADFAGVSLSTVERAERGEAIRIDSIQRLSRCLEASPEALGLLGLPAEEGSGRALAEDLRVLMAPAGQELPPLAQLCAQDLLVAYQRGIRALQDLYFGGAPAQVEALLPLYREQIMLLAQSPTLSQAGAAALAAQSQLLTCELGTDREDFGQAARAGKQALELARQADDRNLEVAAWIGLANLHFHQRQSKAALLCYQQAVARFTPAVTPLLKGRTYAGLAEVYAMRQARQEALRARGLAYELYPQRPEEDPAYGYQRSSRYSLYVFGDAQTQLFLGQPEAAEKALQSAEKKTSDIEREPITRVDLLYYYAQVRLQQGWIEETGSVVAEAVQLARRLGSRLYFNKLAEVYERLRGRWPHERQVVKELEDLFQPW